MGWSSLNLTLRGINCIIYYNYINIVLLKSFFQEDENDEYEEETSLMEETMDQTSNEDCNENGSKILISKKTYEVSC